MNDKYIDNLFDDAIPDADLNAKKIAINTAVSQFSQQTRQEKRESARPIDNQGISPSDKSIWSELMNLLKNPNSGRAFATVAVGFIAFAIVNQMPEQNSVITHSQSVDSEPLVDSDLEAKVETFDTSRIDTLKASAGETKSKLTPLESQSIGEDVVVTAEKKVIAMQDVPIEIRELAAAPTSPTRQNAPVTPVAKIKPDSAAVQDPRTQNPITRDLRSQSHGSLRQNSEGVEKNKDFSVGYSFSDVPAGLIEPSPKANKSIIQLPADSLPKPIIQRPDLGEQYVPHIENALKLVEEEPVSTFSADVDTASYSLLRNQLQRGYLPAPTAVRTEEVVNYFSYDYPYPESKSEPFKASISVLDSPWNDSKKLVHIGIKGYDIQSDKKPDSNLVFLLDVSGSMSAPNKLPLVKQSIALLLNKLKPSDNVSIVVYAGAAGVVLEPTQAKEKTKILAALQRLNAGGSTAGGAGIELAYQLAEQNYNAKAVNRIILATDGDFNVGQHSNEALKTLVERKRDSGVFLSILGFGSNNYQDDMMQTLAQNGNGVAAYIDSISEAKKVLVDQSNATLFTIAKDVKFQVEFNPQTVSDYRLVGYETRHLNREDFNNDKVDAGELGSGHTVTAIYEITPSSNKGAIDPLRYRKKTKKVAPASNTSEYGFLKMRYKLADQTVSKLIEQAIPVKPSDGNLDVNFSIAAASFAQYLKGGKYLGDLSLSDIATMARASKGEDSYGYRSEFIQLVELAQVAKP